MDQKPKKPLKPFHAILLAIASMWLLGMIGVYLLVKFNRWDFIGFDRIDPVYIKLQIAIFYICYIAVRFPAASSAGSIIAMSGFRRPFFVSFLIAFGFEAITFGIRLFWRWPWSAVPDIDQTIPIYGELAGVFLLSCASLLGVWWMVGPIGKFLQSKTDAFVNYFRTRQK
jgi:hypothetical protein